MATNTIAPSWEHALFATNSDLDDALDDLTRDAARMFDAPIVMINFVTHDRVITRSAVGMMQRGTIDRKGSLCSVVATRNCMLNIKDAQQDSRFKNSPVVTNDGVRAYLGMPLHAPDGSVIGAMCVMDTKPRKFGKHQLSLLTVMCAAAEQQWRTVFA